MMRKKVKLAFDTSDRFGAKTMGQPHEERHAAAQAFMESLAQLEQTLEPIKSVEEFPPQKPPETSNTATQSTQDSVQFSLSSFEDAIADLEQFIQNSQTKENS